MIIFSVNSVLKKIRVIKIITKIIVQTISVNAKLHFLPICFSFFSKKLYFFIKMLIIRQKKFIFVLFLVPFRLFFACFQRFLFRNFCRKWKDLGKCEQKEKLVLLILVSFCYLFWIASFLAMTLFGLIIGTLTNRHIGIFILLILKIWHC